MQRHGVHTNGLSTMGTWSPKDAAPAFEAQDLLRAIPQVREPAYVIREASSGRIGVGTGGEANGARDGGGYALLASLPPLYPEWLGDRSFCEAHRTRFPYIAGEMANGIATTALVIAMAKSGMLGFFGAAGLGLPHVEKALDELERTLGSAAPWGINLIHSPSEPSLEERAADLLVRKGVARVCASAFMGLTPAVVHYASSGLHVGPDGRIRRRTHLFAKISRPEVATRFMSPAPADMLAALVERGKLTREEAELAQRVPVAEDITVESDSGGHTDNRPLGALFPSIAALRTDLTERHGYTRPMRVGAAGGLGTPTAIAAAFSLGADYVLTGSINQAALESGLSVAGKQMLAQADLADVIMAPAADMFELGVKVQVLRRGTMFATRAARLYDAYVTYPSLEAIPNDARKRLEKEVLNASLDTIWSETRQFWLRRDAGEVERAERDPKHRMALVFRWYLGKSSRWAIEGDPARRADYQIWCGPAMGAFNTWVRGSFLANPENRSAAQIALNLLEGAAVISRAQQLRASGVPVPAAAFHFRPRPLS
ncbi:PfaD family polyunsaturated fatty acid/polyketide biosynthesis protein [Pendulispora brunnea]|uniref:PfaD family polyunsaturated fatty acid/polyketide biosynthesis protein n=1 Tax=Pendulispora brunnea TaxID=2905690 RepID=A0ABZ2K4E3_9BACT